MAGFFVDSNPWGPASTLLTGPTTSNMMGGVAPAQSSGGSSGISMGALGFGMQAFGAIASAFGSYQAAKSQASTLKFQADMSQIAARMAERSAQSVLDQGQKEVGRLTLRAGQVKSSQRTAMAANGIDLGTGNAAEVQASTDLMKEIDKNTITANAVRSAWGYRTQSVNAQNDALIKNASARGINPAMAGGSSLLSSAGSLAQSWTRLNQAGAFNSPSNASTPSSSEW